MDCTFRCTANAACIWVLGFAATDPVSHHALEAPADLGARSTCSALRAMLLDSSEWSFDAFVMA